MTDKYTDVEMMQRNITELITLMSVLHDLIANINASIGALNIIAERMAKGIDTDTGGEGSERYSGR